MRRVLTTTVGLFFLVGATTAVGKSAETKISKSDQVLKEGLHAVALNASANANAQNKENSQGAEHASDRAILRVCNHDNPSALRSAICKNFVSPD